MELEIFEDQTFEHEMPSKGNYTHCRFVNIDFKGFNFNEWVFSECTFVNCDMSLVKCQQTAFMNVKFNACKMLGFNFENCKDFLFEVSFENCLLSLANFYKKRLKQTQFVKCELKEVDFTLANLNKTLFKECDLSGAIFSETILEETDFRTAYNFSIDPEKNKLKKAKFTSNGLQGLLHKYQLNIYPA
jgi:uncharacterized protein YjbI with pentapeptide repeats